MFGDHSRSVGPSVDFNRIKALPRRTGFDPGIVNEMSVALRLPNSKAMLFPIQAQALYELGEHGSSFLPVGVGEGKTLISLLAGRVLDARRPVLLLPAHLVEKTERERARYAKDWRVSKNLRVFSYQGLGRISAARELELYLPDLIIADEVHCLKNKRAGVTRRVARYMSEHPDTKFVGMSGTVMRNSLREFAHILKWSHKQGSPLPIHEETLGEWADAVDEKVNALSRRTSGVLRQLGEYDNDASDLSVARQCVRSRLVDTLGVVVSSGEQSSQSCPASIYIKGHVYEVNAATENNFELLRETWCTPDGWACSEAVEIWRHARELAIGLHYEWAPRPPEEWLHSRKQWAKFVRDFLTKSKKLDTELQVVHAVDSGDVDDFGALSNWRKIKPIFTINSRPVWHDESALIECEKWAKEEPGIVWVEHVFFAKELAKRTGMSYYGAGGLDAQGRFIEDAKGSVIASVASCGIGRNLQRWRRNLITAVPCGASQWEQLIGRTHRQGQGADVVDVDVLIGCFEHIDGFERAKDAAKMIEDTIGHRQKILYSDVDMPDTTRWRGARWNK